MKSFKYIRAVSKTAQNGIKENMMLKKNKKKERVKNLKILYSLLASEIIELEYEINNQKDNINNLIYELKDVLVCSAMLLHRLEEITKTRKTI